MPQIQEEMFRMSVPNLRVNGHNYEDFVDGQWALLDLMAGY